MITSSIYAKEDLGIYPEAIQKALRYLQEKDFTQMEPGVYEIRGKDMYAQVFDTLTEPAEKKLPEVHEKYVDIQFLASGREKLGFAPDMGTCEVSERIPERDLIYYKEVENEWYICALPGSYSIFFPNDIHRPAVAFDQPETIRKVVVKVNVKLLSN